MFSTESLENRQVNHHLNFPTTLPRRRCNRKKTYKEGTNLLQGKKVFNWPRWTEQGWRWSLSPQAQIGATWFPAANSREMWATSLPNPSSSPDSYQGPFRPLLRSPRGSSSHWPTWQPLPARPLPGPTSRWPWSSGKGGRLAKKFTARAPTPALSPLPPREPPPPGQEAEVPTVTSVPARRKASLFRAAPSMRGGVASFGRAPKRFYFGLTPDPLTTDLLRRALISPSSAKSNS